MRFSSEIRVCSWLIHLFCWLVTSCLSCPRLSSYSCKIWMVISILESYLLLRNYLSILAHSRPDKLIVKGCMKGGWKGKAWKRKALKSQQRWAPATPKPEQAGPCDSGSMEGGTDCPTRLHSRWQRPCRARSWWPHLKWSLLPHSHIWLAVFYALLLCFPP